MNLKTTSKKHFFYIFVFTVAALVLFADIVFARPDPSDGPIIPPSIPGSEACDDPGSAACTKYCSGAGKMDSAHCPPPPLNDQTCWVGKSAGCPSIPIPLPVIGWYPDQIPVRVASDPEANSWEGVWVWSPGGVEGKDKYGGVYVFNKETEPLWTRCYPPEKQCTYFIELYDNESLRVGDLLNYADLFMQNLLNIWTNTCPTYMKIANVKITSDPKDATKPPKVEFVDNVDESSCKNIIDSWDTILVDKVKAVKLSLSEALEDVEYEFFDAFLKKDLIDQVNEKDSFEEEPESVRPQGYLYNAIGGTFVEPNTSFLAFFRRATRPMSKAQISLMIDSYVENEQKKAGDALLEDVRQGSGLFSKYEVSETTSVDSMGETHPSKFFATYPSGVAFGDMMTTRQEALDVFVNTEYYHDEIAPKIFPQLDPGDNRYKGGPPQLNSLLNTTMNGGSGIYSGGGGGGVPQPSPQPTDADCEIDLSDASILMGLNERREYIFSVDVEKNNGNGSINDIDKIEISFDSPSLASATPSLLHASNASGTRDFPFDVIARKAGNTDVNIETTLKATVGGRTCSASFDLEVLNFERRKCNATKCQAALAVPDPDLTLYTCFGTPDDNLSECTSMNSNCMQEWCVDIGDTNHDGFNALCYDTCDVSHRQSCRAAGYICDPLATPSPTPSALIIKMQKQFSSLNTVKKAINPFLKFLNL